jgi:hypothetical protein
MVDVDTARKCAQVFSQHKYRLLIEIESGLHGNMQAVDVGLKELKRAPEGLQTHAVLDVYREVSEKREEVFLRLLPCSKYLIIHKLMLMRR